MFNIPNDQHYYPEPTFNLNDPYCYNQLPTFYFDVDKPIMEEE